jgi:hypothetical protein
MKERKNAEVESNGGPACGRCFMQVARYAPQVVGAGGTYHRECYEAWYFGRHGRRPRLLSGASGDRHRYQARDLAA